MAVVVEIGHAKAHLSDLLAKVEAGEEVVIARGDVPVARLIRVVREDDHLALVEEIKAARAGRSPTTADDILA